MNNQNDTKINGKRIGVLAEFRLLIRQAVLLLIYDKRNFIIAISFPIIAALITVFVAGENMFVHYDGTKSACFVLSSAAIWCGLFNSIQVIVKERASIKRDYAAGMRLYCYTISKSLVQFLLCLVQSLLLTLSFFGVKLIFGNEFPDRGLLQSSALLELYISLLLVMLASDAMGLLLSCLVKKAETANVLAPYILIFELILSGVLFPLKGFFQFISIFMVSRWGMEALGSICDLNIMPLEIQMSIPSVPHESENMFLHTDYHLLEVWIILALFTAIQIILGSFLLHRVARDSR